MHFSLKLAAMAAFLFAAAAPAVAEQVCGAEVAAQGATVTATFDGIAATCAKDSLCSIALGSADGVRVDMERASVDGSWLVKVSAPSSIDTGAGIDLVFNGADETRVAPEFLIASESRDTARVDDDVSQIMVSTMAESSTMTTTAQLVGGRKVSVETALSGLTKAMDWTDCAQARQ